MRKNSRIYLAGHTGLLGSAIFRKLKDKGFSNIITRTHRELDLTRQADVESFFKRESPEFVILAAAKIGGIYANMTYPVQFLYDNIYIQSNVISSSCQRGAKKLLFFGSACSYPRECPQPMKEEYMLSGYIEPTNEPYAVAKIAGIKMCQAYNRQYGKKFICAIPTNIYGPGDNFDISNSHVIPALLKRFHEAKIKNEDAVAVWGTGKPLREFIYVEDVADACIFLMERYEGLEAINIGTGKEVSVKNLAYLIKEVVSFKGKITFDLSRPDGSPRKVLDVRKVKKLGWQAETTVKDGIEKTYKWYTGHLKNGS